jgi:hypothetical protein
VVRHHNLGRLELAAQVGGELDEGDQRPDIECPPLPVLGKAGHQGAEDEVDRVQRDDEVEALTHALNDPTQQVGTG